MSERDSVTNALTGDYLSLLIALQENPLGTVDELHRITGNSKPTVAKRLRELQGYLGVGKRATKRRYFVVKPILDIHKLGFEFVDVVLGTKSHKSMLRLEKIADDHPYTSYRGRCFGHYNGLHMQFRIPVGTRHSIETLVERLKDDGTVSDSSFFVSGPCRTEYSTMRIKGWDSETMVWKFDWKEWFDSKVGRLTSNQPEIPSEKPPDWFTKKDAHILRELMKGARRKNLDIITSLNSQGVDFTPQTFSRRYQMLRDEVILGFRATLDPTAFDIYNNVLIFGNADETYLHKLSSRLSKNPIPFQSAMRVCGTNMFWSIRLQASHLSLLLSNLHSNLDSMSVYVVDYTNTLLYHLWAETFDDSIPGWRTDKKFMIEDVLK
ncbi:MAG: Lrp/AsnC family transcriptional regulator [Candidatus Thorarchaeota archaeon]